MEYDNINNNYSGSSTGLSYGVSWMELPQHSTLQAGGGSGGANPLDLSSAIAHELQRSSAPAAWGPEAFIPQLPQYYSIPRFKDASANSGNLQQQHQQQQHHDSSTTFFSCTSRGFPSSSSSLLPHGRGMVESSTAVCSPWIERMMQPDVTPTPCPSLGISTCLSLSGQRENVSLDWSETHSLPRESISADLCTDDDDLETHPIDEKRKRRMLSNRASAQRSRQRRQERLDQLEVLTAQLRVENSTLQKKLNSVVQVAKKLEDQNTNLLKKVEKLTKLVDVGKVKNVFDDCEAISQQTTSATSSEMIGGRTSGDVNGNGVSTSGVNEDLSNKEEMSPLRRSFSACRVGKKRSFDEAEIAGPSPLNTHAAFSEASPFVMDPMLETDRWFELADCFK